MIKVKDRKLLLLPGDGIGPEVVREVKKIIEWFNKNKSLDFKIEEQVVVELSEYSKRKEEIEIDLEKQEIKYGNKIKKFEVDSFKKKCLIEGLDDIALSLENTSQIDNFEKNIKENSPWLLKND